LQQANLRGLIAQSVDHSGNGELRRRHSSDRRELQKLARSREGAESEYYPWLTMGIASLVLFILLVEWLRPMQQASAITQVYIIEPFQLALFGFVALNYLRIHGLIMWPLKLIVILLVIGQFYYDSYLYEWTWWEDYLTVTQQDIESIVHKHPSAISGENRTLLLLAGLAMVSHALHYIVVRRQYPGWFVAVTIGYLAGLQIAFGLQTTAGIMTSLAAGLLMIVLLQPVRWRSIMSLATSSRMANGAAANTSGGQTKRTESAYTAQGAVSPNTAGRGAANIRAKTVAAGKHAAGYVAAVLIASAALAAGWLAAEDQPKLSQPLRWNVIEFAQDVARLANGRWSIAAGQDWSRLANLSLTGFSVGDYELGGSAIPANFPIFTARSDKLTYWRGEIKAHYDGSSWSDTPAWFEDALRDNTLATGDEPVEESFLRMMPIEQEVHLDSTSAKFLQGTLFAGGEITDVTELAGGGEEYLAPQLHPIRRDGQSQRYTVDTGEVVLGSYRIKVEPIPHDYFDSQRIDEAYRAARERVAGHTLDAQQANGTYFAAVESDARANLDNNLIHEAERTADQQTSAGGLSAEDRLRYTQLPHMSERVYELAAQVTAGAETDLDKARAIAAYLRENYTYDLNATAKPDEGMEFVENFLFEQRIGYCDHFSTAMAVMLRMNGIPSRWVKGFAPGDVQIDESGYVWSDVRALHAHSWVEAYIQGIGWVAFEPTPSYAGSLEAASVVLAAGTPSPDGTRSEPQWWQGPALILASEVTKEVEKMEGDWLAWLEMKLTALKDSLMSTAWTEAAVWASAAAAAIALAIILFVLLRHRWDYIRLERRISQMERRGGTALMLELIWQRIFRKYGPLKPGQTLREYVQELKLRKPEQREALAELALLYEAIRYDERLPERVSRGRMSRLWREAIG